MLYFFPAYCYFMNIYRFFTIRLSWSVILFLQFPMIKCGLWMYSSIHKKSLICNIFSQLIAISWIYTGSSKNKNVLQEKEINVLMICIVRLWKQTKLDTHLAPALPPRILDNPVRLNNKKWVIMNKWINKIIKFN